MRISRMVAVLGASALLASCHAQQSVDDATAQVQVFHTELDAGQYDAIWMNASPDFRKVAKRADLEKLLAAIHKKLGAVKQSKQTGWKTNATTDGTFVTLQMDTTFEKGTGRETFLYIRKGKDLELEGYNINSTDMMEN